MATNKTSNVKGNTQAPTQNQQGPVMRALSALVERMKLAGAAGLQFDGARDLYNVFGYKKSLSSTDLVARYNRQDIAARIVNMYADATWSDPPKIIATSVSNFDEMWSALVRQQRIWSAFSRVDKLCNLGRYSVLMLGFDDTSVLEAPVTTDNARKLLYVKPLAQVSAKIKRFVRNPLDPRFGLPEAYEISLQNEESAIEGESSTVIPLFQTQTQNITVHWTRIVHVVEDPLESEIYGNPRLVPVFNLLDDFLKIVGGSAETFWLAANRGIQADIDKEMQLSAEDAADMSAMMEEYQHQLRRILRTRGVKINSIGSDVPDPSGAFLMLQTMLAGAAGIPRRILFGSEAGQLSSEQDRANWARRVTERRMNFANPYVLIPFITACQRAGVLPEATVESMEIEWDDAFHQSPLEKSQTSAQSARSVVNLSRQTLAGFPLVTQEEARSILGLKGTINQDAIELMEEYRQKIDAEADLARAEADIAESTDPNASADSNANSSSGRTDTTTDGEVSPADRPARQRE